MQTVELTDDREKIKGYGTGSEYVQAGHVDNFRVGHGVRMVYDCPDVTPVLEGVRDGGHTRYQQQDEE